MQELLAQLLEYLWGIWRFRWGGLIVAWLVAVGGWVWVSQVPEEYLATARIHVDTNSVLRPLLRGLAIQPDVGRRVELMSRTLLSRPNLEKLMRMADLDLQVKTELEKEQLLTGLRETISLTGDRRNTSLYSLAFRHRDRNTAKRIVQSLITVFIESSLGDKRKEGVNAQEFLNKQIAGYEKRLAEAENSLAAFKQRNVGTMPGDKGGYYARLGVANSQLSAARLQLREMENRRRELRRQIAGEEPVFLSSSVDEIQMSSPLDGRIQSLQRMLDNLLLKYTDRHPEVIQLRTIISDLEAEKHKEIEEAMAAAPARQSGFDESPVYQQMRSMLAQTEATVAELKVRVAEYASRVKTLDDKVDNIPVIEAELQQLNRDYNVISQQHGALLKRRESARLSEKVEQNADNVKFRVIDPAFVPLMPTEPDKLLLNSGVFVVSIITGIGIAFLFSLFRPVVSNRRTLGQITGLPVLGSVMLITSPAMKRRAFFSGILFISFTICLFLAFAGVNIGQDIGVDDLMRNIADLSAGLL